MEPGRVAATACSCAGGHEPKVGDAVLYSDPVLGVRVLHRVIANEDGRLLLQGDANDFVDDARPLSSDVIGSYWFSIPRAGSLVFWLQQPLHAALLAFALTILARGDIGTDVCIGGAGTDTFHSSCETRIQ